jgi:type II secretory pathway pseudopilin PulG
MPISHCLFPIENGDPTAQSQSPILNRQLAIGNRPAFTPGFTLVELMISLAMVLLLIIGINYVFRSATDAVSAGQSLNAINSDAQATQPLLFDDLRNASKNPPCFLIASQLVTQFLNSDDAKTSSDPTIIPTDNAGDQVKIGNLPSPAGLSPAMLNNRNHRADLLKFFAHFLYHRRSGNDGTFTGSETSDDAYIELGHAALPANDLSGFYGPSSLPNTGALFSNYMIAGNNVTGVPRLGAYASDWVLARRVTLLDSPVLNSSGSQPISTGDYYYAVSATTPTGIDGKVFGVNMTPLSYGTIDSSVTPANAAQSTGSQAQSSRYDLAGITLDQFDRLIANAILGWQNTAPQYTGASLWWNPLVYAFGWKQTTSTPPQYYTVTLPTGSVPNISAPYVIPYFNWAGAAVPGFTGDHGQWLNRPQCNPLIQTPVTAAALAEMAPYFLQHCSQFVVEYAGDYLQQDNAQFLPLPSPPNTVNPHYGAMTALGPDGQIDFYVDANGNKHTRWYGMPRSSTGASHAGDSSGTKVLIRGYDPGDVTVGGKDDPTVAGGPGAYNAPLNFFTDVIPLRDYYTMFLNLGKAGQPLCSPPWEVDVNFDPPGGSEDYAANPQPYNGTVTGTNHLAFNDPNVPPRYVAAWHDDSPAMIRILIKLDDPNNKVKDGPWYEYVFRLK